MFLLVIIIINTQSIDVDAIGWAESNLKPIINKGAYGPYQITNICLKDYNRYHDVKYTLRDMLDMEKGRLVAEWYVYIKIPQLYPVSNNIDILGCYRYGPKKWKKIRNSYPDEFKNYLKRYYEYLKKEK